MALTMATQETIFLKMLTKEFNSESNKAVKIFGDNQGSIALVKNPINHNRLKHIDIKFHFIREAYTNSFTHLLSTDENIAGLMMTNQCSKLKIDKFREMLFGI